MIDATVDGENTALRGRPIYWHGDAIRRAANAIREVYSTDFYVMVRRALEAIRSSCCRRTRSPCPLYPSEPTSSVRLAMSVECPEHKVAALQPAAREQEPRTGSRLRGQR